MSRLSEAIQVYRERGIQYLFFRLINYMSWLGNRYVRNMFDLYWNFKGGKQKFTINGVSAVFHTTTGQGGDVIRNHINREYDLIGDLLENIKNEDVFLDIGANLGLHSNFAGHICEK